MRIFIEPRGQTGKKKRYYPSAPQSMTAPDCGPCAPIPATIRRSRSKFIDHVLSNLPFQVEKVQTDNGQEFASAFHWHLLDMGIGHVKIRPRTPRLNRKVERSHRIDSNEFYRPLEGDVIDDANLFAERLQQ